MELIHDLSRLSLISPTPPLFIIGCQRVDSPQRSTTLPPDLFFFFFAISYSSLFCENPFDVDTQPCSVHTILFLRRQAEGLGGVGGGVGGEGGGRGVVDGVQEVSRNV